MDKRVSAACHSNRPPDFELTVRLQKRDCLRYFLRWPKRCELDGCWPVRPGMIVAPSR